MPTATKKKATKKKPLKDPNGGLTAAGRAHYKKTTGANLRPGVKGPADTPEKMRRTGSFLRRHFANPQGPMQDADGNPTRLALCARAWGEKVPEHPGDAQALADKGAILLARYKKLKAIEKAAAKKVAKKKPAAKKKALGPR